MGRYFDKLPKVYYSLEDDHKHPQVVTDVTFAVRILEPYAQDAKFYYPTVIKDGLKPEDVAYLVYGDVELHWIVLQFNRIVNPRYDWPLSSLNLDKYIIEKYGSIANAQSTVHTYYKIITNESSASDAPSEQKIEIGAAEYANVAVDLAGNSYLLTNGETVNIKTNRTTLSCYDYEVELNESRREIKLIQKQYIDQIRKSFNELTNKFST